MSEAHHDIVVVGVWHQDETAGVRVICKTCTKGMAYPVPTEILNGYDTDDELTPAQIQAAAAAHIEAGDPKERKPA